MKYLPIIGVRVNNLVRAEIDSNFFFFPATTLAAISAHIFPSFYVAAQVGLLEHGNHTRHAQS